MNVHQKSSTHTTHFHEVAMKLFPTVALLCAALLVSTSSLFGQLLLQETFNTPTTDLTTQPGWTTVTGVGSSVAPPYIVVKPGSALLYPGYIESGVGNSATLSGAGQDAQTVVGTATSGTVYLAFMIKVDSASASGDYCWLVRNTSNHNRWRMWLRNSNAGANFEFGIGMGSTLQSYTNNKYTFGTTYLVIAKYDFNTSATNDAKLSLWVNPAPSSFGGAEDATPVIKDYTESTTADFATINRFALIMNGVGSAPTFSIGGIRMGTTWVSVLPPPPLYYNGTGAIDNPASWGSNIDGSGTHPTDFAADNQLWLVRNTTAVNLTTTWQVTGQGSRVVVGPGVNFTVGSSAILSATVDVNSGATLTLKRGYFWPQFGNIAGTVSFDNAAGIALDADYTLPAGPGVYELKSGDLDVAGFTLRIKGRFRTNGYKIFGNGTCSLDSAATLFISSPAGIMSSGASGDVQAATRTFSRYATYVYAGARNQVTGNAVPDTVAGLTIQMGHRDSTTTLTKHVATTGNLTMTTGKFKLGAYNLWFSNPSGQSDSSYVITDGTGALVRPVSTTSQKTMPVGSAAEYRVARLTYPTAPAATNISVRYVPGDPGSTGLPDSIARYYKGGSWTITSDGTPGQPYSLELRSAGMGLDSSALRILTRTGTSAPWTYAGSAAIPGAGIVTEPGVTTYGQFAVGERKPVTGVGDESGLPRAVALMNNYPNPFNPSTMIAYQIPSQMHVTLGVYNLLGQRVATLVDAVQPGGSYQVQFDARSLASGVYWYQLRAGTVLQTKSMMLVR